MEIGDIQKVANRKGMTTEVEKLREKVSRENAKIIKLKVAQDTAYWELKEKLRQVEKNHERLQQNMVEVQMQHEAISGQYQDELRLRPETLNKLSSTREICGVLVDYSEGLKETLSRCKADQVALYDAYHKSEQLVREIKNKQEQKNEGNEQLIESLREKVSACNEHQGQMLQYLTAAKQQTEAEMAAIRRHNEQLLVSNAELQRDLDNQNGSLATKDELIDKLREEIKSTIDEYNQQCSEGRTNIIKLENEIRESKEAFATVKAELSDHQELVSVVSGERDELQRKVAALEETHGQLLTGAEVLKKQLTESAASKVVIEQNLQRIMEEKIRLEKETFDNVQLLTDIKQQVQELQLQLGTMEKEKMQIASELNVTLHESNQKDVKIDELIAEEKRLIEKINEIDNAFTCYRESSSEKITKMSTELQEKEKEIDSKADMINLLKYEVKTGTDARSRLEGIVQKLKRELEVEKEAGVERERKMGKQIEQLETTVRDKENDLSKQMSLILELRNEKEKLQEKIQEKQQTIGNIQKELTGRMTPKTIDPPEMDDNAVMLTPSYQKIASRSSIIPKKTKVAKPRIDTKELESMLFNLVSDSSRSMESNNLNVSEVDRRFAALARGESVQQTSLATFKRRAPLPPSSPISLSQMRNDLKSRDRSFFKHKRVDPTKKNQNN